MDSLLFVGSRDVRLARTAMGLIASSFVLLVVVLAMIVGAANLPALIREQPGNVALGVLLVLCYAASFVALAMIPRASSERRSWAWLVSLVAVLSIVCVLLYLFGAALGAAIGSFEIAAAIVHLMALSE